MAQKLPAPDAKPDLLTFAQLVKLAPIEEPGFTMGFVTKWYPPCGSGVRPYLMAGKPYLGSVFRVVYQMFSLPREDGIYSVTGAWVIVSLAPPQNEEEPTYVFPNGCPLLWRLDAPSTLVWGFGGIVGYEDALMHRAPNGRSAVLSVVIPNDRAFVGQRLWTQLIMVDRNEFKTSQLIEVKIGDPASGPR